MVLTDMWMPEMDGSAPVQAVRREPRLVSLPVTLESLREALRNAGIF